MLIHATYNAFATATGVSRFLYSGQQPYQMSVPDMITKMSSNALFFLGLLPFAFLLARELRSLLGPSGVERSDDSDVRPFDCSSSAILTSRIHLGQG
jgi:hypothetical protein